MRCLASERGAAQQLRVRVGGPPRKSPAGGDMELKPQLLGKSLRAQAGPALPAQMVQLEDWTESLQKMMLLEERKRFCGGPFSILKAVSSV